MLPVDGKARSESEVRVSGDDAERLRVDHGDARLHRIRALPGYRVRLRELLKCVDAVGRSVDCQRDHRAGQLHGACDRIRLLVDDGEQLVTADEDGVGSRVDSDSFGLDADLNRRDQVSV